MGVLENILLREDAVTARCSGAAGRTATRRGRIYSSHRTTRARWLTWIAAGNVSIAVHLGPN